jgi:hypothetical protein
MTYISVVPTATLKQVSTHIPYGHARLGYATARLRVPEVREVEKTDAFFEERPYQEKPLIEDGISPGMGNFCD